MLLCLAWQERQITGWVVNRCPVQITSATPIKVKSGPKKTITHFDFKRVLMVLTLTMDLNLLTRLNAFIDPFL
jgi:hypothetical protein